MNKNYWIIVPLMASGLTGCVSELEQFFTPNAGIPADPGTLPGAPGGGSTPDTTVCDPFAGNGPSPYPPTSGHGLQAKLKYLSDDMPRYTDVMSYIANGVALDATLYFTQLNTPTRAFDRGFSNQNGYILKRTDGTPLFEYFSIEFESRLQLPEGQANKKYEFALLSDDGAVLSFNNGNGYQTAIDNDGTHPTRMACSNGPTTLSSLTKLPIKVSYYQGPRQHIALVMLMREWDDDDCEEDRNEPLCGAEGNDFFYDSTVDPSEPTDNYRALLSRGWAPVPPEYFRLPGDPPPPNPCF